MASFLFVQVGVSEPDRKLFMPAKQTGLVETDQTECEFLNKVIWKESQEWGEVGFEQ